MICERINEAMPGAITDSHSFRGDKTIVVDPLRYLEVVRLIFDDGFQLMIGLTAVDWPERQPRFDVVVHFQNLVSQERLRIKVPIAEGQTIQSITGIHRSADWFEREVFDMFGIFFEGHPGLKRLMMWQGFEGHPLRKDFQMDGNDPWCKTGMGEPYAESAKSLADCP